MSRRLVVALAASLSLVLSPGGAAASFTPGAPGVGDPYFPLDGNGGYDVRHYLLDVTYDPATDLLTGVATITRPRDAEPVRLQPRLRGPDRPLDQGRRPAGRRGRRDGGELTVTPPSGHARRSARFTTVVALRRRAGAHRRPIRVTRVSSTPTTARSSSAQPHVAATWFPVNDHPIDKAAYTFRDHRARRAGGDRQRRARDAAHPARLDDLDLGRARSRWRRTSRRRRSASSTSARTATDGIRFWDALDPDLFAPDCAAYRRPVRHLAGRRPVVQAADPHHHRARRRRRAVVLDHARHRADWDFVFVEAHTVGQDDWTTLPDLNGHTAQDTGFSCPSWLGPAPVPRALPDRQRRRHVLARPARPASGGPPAAPSDGYEQWTVDLSAYAGSDVEVSISYASDDIVQGAGVVRRRHRRSRPARAPRRSRTTATRSTAGPSRAAGWQRAQPERLDRRHGGRRAADAGRVVRGLVRPPAARSSTSWPATSAGTRSRPPAGSSTTLDARLRPGEPDPADLLEGLLRRSDRSPDAADSVVVHELAHQWVGDSLAARGLAAHLAQRGLRHLRRVAVERARRPRHRPGDLRLLRGASPPTTRSGRSTIGDPGPDHLFDFPVYFRGAMTLHALRLDRRATRDFFRILRVWARSQAGGNVTTDQFIALAERVSGAAARRAVRRLAVHGREAGGHRAGAGRRSVPQDGLDQPSCCCIRFGSALTIRS